MIYYLYNNHPKNNFKIIISIFLILINGYYAFFSQGKI
jgi:hypothetical protein